MDSTAEKKVSALRRFGRVVRDVLFQPTDELSSLEEKSEALLLERGISAAFREGREAGFNEGYTLGYTEGCQDTSRSLVARRAARDA